MKQMKKQLILWLAAIALITTSCVEDDYAEGSRTPIKFTVSMAGNKAATRSAVNDTWNGGEAVAVQMTSGGISIVKKYKIDNSGLLVKLVPFDSSVQPFYWPHSGSTEVTVSAWYPYAESKQTVATTNTDIKDQSTTEKYEAANLMEAANVTRAYNAEGPITPETPFELTFSHRMAKLIIRPFHDKDTEGHDTSQLIAAEVTKTTAKATNLCSDEITAFRNDRQFEVLVVPQTIPATTKFIKLSYHNDNTKSSTFEFSEATSKTLEAGKTYIFNVKFNTAADSAFVVTLNTAATPLYDGTEKNYPGISSVTCNGKTLLDTDYEITGVTSAINAGTYTVTVKGKGQYSSNNSSNFEWTINKKDGILTVPTAIGGSLGTSSVNMFDTFNKGSFKDGEASAGTISYGLSTGNVPPINWYQTRDDSAESPQLITAAGNYKIWYKVVPDDNHKLSDSDAANFNTAGISNSPIEIVISEP